MGGSSSDGNLLKFPVFFQNCFKKRNLAFPDGTEWDYDLVRAYRVVEWKKGRSNSVTSDDFKSYAELGKCPRGKSKEEAENDPEYYGVSLFDNMEAFENLFDFPNPRKRAFCGMVVSDCGPKYENGKNGHISWWLYSDAFETIRGSFIIVEEGDEDD